jgi:hypothetical protein
MAEALTYVTGASLVAVAALCVLILHKVRRIHQMQFDMGLDIKQARREVEALYGQLEALDALKSLLCLEVPLPALRGWAGSPDFLLILAEHALRERPVAILECSSGASTLTLARCAQLSGQGHVYSLEHDPVYAKQTRAALARRGLESWATVVDAPLTPHSSHGGQPWYSVENLPSHSGPFEMLVIDGPPASTAPLARHPALPLLWSRLDWKCVTFLDDADRSDEKAAVEKWIEQFPNLQVSVLAAEKGCVRLAATPASSSTLHSPS